MPRVLFPDFRPDAAEGFDSQYTSVAQNVFPIEEGFGPARGFTVRTDQLGAACRGAFEAVAPDGTKVIFAATATAIYKRESDAWTDVSGPSAPFGGTEDVFWSFEQYGNFVIADNANNAPQKFNLDGGTAFEPLGGTPPNGRIVRLHKEFVWHIGGIDASPSDDASRTVTWSDAADPEEYGVGTLSDFQVLPDPGPIIGAAVGESVLIFQQKKLHRFVYTGEASLVYQRLEVDTGRGLMGQEAIAVANNACYYLGSDGFYRTDFTGATTPIGVGRVNRWFFNRVSRSNLLRVKATAHPKFPRIYFSYSTTSNSAVNYDEMLIYDWMLDRWAGPVALPHQYLLPVNNPGMTLEEVGAIYPTLEDISPLSLDDPQFAEGEPTMGAIDQLGRFCTMDGDILEAVLETGAVIDPSPRRKLISGAYPLIEGDLDLTVQVGTRDKPSDTESWSSVASPNGIGRVPLRSSGRIVRMRMTIAENASWSKVQGLDVDAELTGLR